jgi:hypothetical protein
MIVLSFVLTQNERTKEKVNPDSYREHFILLQANFLLDKIATNSVISSLARNF